MSSDEMFEPVTETTQAQLSAEAADLVEQFDSGHITAAEFHERLTAINERKEAIFRALDREEMATEMVAAKFQNAAQRFLKAHPEYGADKPVMHNALDREVARLQRAALERGEDIFDPGIIGRAHKNLAAVTKARREPDAEVTDEAPDTDFGQLDRLTGTRLEEALAALSPDERDAFLER